MHIAFKLTGGEGPDCKEHQPNMDADGTGPKVLPVDNGYDANFNWMSVVGTFGAMCGLD